MGHPFVDGSRVAVEFWTNMKVDGDEVTLPGCLLLEFADDFEERFVRQARDEDRNIAEATLETGWDLLSKLPESALTRIDRKTLEKYHPAYRDK